MDDLGLVVGLAIEGAGLVVAGVGLGLTWKDNAAPDRKLKAVLGQMLDTAIRRLRGRTVVGRSLTTSWNVEANLVGEARTEASAEVIRHRVPLRPDMTQAELLAAITQNLDAIQQLALDIGGGLDSHQVASAQQVGQLRSELEKTETGLVRRVKEAVVDGVPVAAGGLLVTLIGVIVQLIAVLRA